MPDPEKPELDDASRRMLREVGMKQSRMRKAREGDQSFWSSLEVLGVVGWSIALPTLLGIALGLFLDKHWPARIAWTPALLFAGLAFGCANAWIHIRGKQP